MWTSAPRIRVKMEALVLTKSMDTLANASQDTLVIIVVIRRIHIFIYVASIDEKDIFLELA